MTVYEILMLYFEDCCSCSRYQTSIIYYPLFFQYYLSSFLLPYLLRSMLAQTSEDFSNLYTVHVSRESLIYMNQSPQVHLQFLHSRDPFSASCIYHISLYLFNEEITSKPHQGNQDELLLQLLLNFNRNMNAMPNLHIHFWTSYYLLFKLILPVS